MILEPNLKENRRIASNYSSTISVHCVINGSIRWSMAAIIFGKYEFLLNLFPSVYMNAKNIIPEKEVVVIQGSDCAVEGGKIISNFIKELEKFVDTSYLAETYLQLDVI